MTDTLDLISISGGPFVHPDLASVANAACFSLAIAVSIY